MKRAVVRVLGGFIVLLTLTYTGDYVALRFRIPNHRQPFGSITVTPLYVIHEKNGKVEYQFAPPQEQTCVRSWFPHFGYSPCWYVSRHQEKRIDI